MARIVMAAMTKTPSNLTLTEIMARFGTDEAARDYLEAVRWPNGPVCPHCGNKDEKPIYPIAANPAKGIRAGLRQCATCEGTFTVTVGTIFEKSHMPLRKWLIAWYLLCTSKKRVSALQIQRMLEIGSYRSAWFMMHRIRYALRGPFFADKRGGGGQIVEANETYVSGKPRRGGKPSKCGRGTKKIPVVALAERGGRMRSRMVQKVTGKTLRNMLDTHLDPSAHLVTNEFAAYRKPGRSFASHRGINRGSGEYVRDEVHTNPAEGYFSLFKRGVNGTFHHIGSHYMDQYLAEFDFRYNHRDVTDGERTVAGLRKVEGKRLMLRQSKSLN
jgi:transposase-like protein